jgi:hypothetical protein
LTLKNCAAKISTAIKQFLRRRKMATARIKRRDIGGKGRRWELIYCISDSPDFRNNNSKSPELFRFITFRTETNEEAKIIALKLLQKAVAGMRNPQRRLDLGGILPMDPRLGESFRRTDDAIQLKPDWTKEQLLGIKNPNDVLIHGYEREEPCPLCPRR